MSARWRFRFAIAAAVVAFAGAYANSLNDAFNFDDSHVIEQNLFIRDLANVPRFFTDARTFSSLPQNATYRPLLSLSLAIDYAIAGGLAPPVYHATSLVCLLALWLLLWRFYARVLDFAGRDAWRTHVALVAATLFAVHTVN